MTDTTVPPGFENLTEYLDAELYDAENKEVGPAGPFFLELAQELDGPVLELGCGTGRLGIPMAQQGIDYTGLDVVPGMLDLAKRKTGDLPIQWVAADARSFQLERQFRLIFDNGAAFLHLLERADHEALLAAVHKHLAPDGQFVLAMPLFRLTAMRDSEETEWFSYTDHVGRDVRVSGTVQFETVKQIFHEDAIRRWIDEHGQEVRREAPLARRVFFPPEIEALLHYNGFAVVSRYGEWDRSPLTDESPRMIFVSQRVV